MTEHATNAIAKMPGLAPGASWRVDDVIIAPATPPGPGARAILRLTGSRAWHVFQPLLIDGSAWFKVPSRGRHSVQVRLPEVYSPLPVELQWFAAPRTYTGQDLLEIHLISAPPLVEALLADLIRQGARMARPGEFTLRAFLAGKLDLTQAEAVLTLTTSSDTDELKTALAQLAGGLSRPLESLRQEVLFLLAEVEAGLDFADEDLAIIDDHALLRRIRATSAQLQTVRDQLEQRGQVKTAFRVVLTGAPNAGKSSLLNALVGRDAAIVSPQAGTTRDFVSATLMDQGIPFELIDTAGHEDPRDDISVQAQVARLTQLQQADLVLWCFDATRRGSEVWKQDRSGGLMVATKIDLPRSLPLPAEAIGTSAVTGEGLENLRGIMVKQAQQRLCAATTSLSRCRDHIERAMNALDLAASHTAAGRMELVAAELRASLDQLGCMVGAVYSEDLLDRIFSQFCIGK